MFVLVSFYMIFVADLYIFPTKSINEKVAQFKIKSIGSSRYSTGYLNYKIYTQSGKMYDFGNLYPEELMEVNSEFSVKETCLFSNMKMAVTQKSSYNFGNGFFFFLYTITLIVMLVFFIIGWRPHQTK